MHWNYFVDEILYLKMLDIHFIDTLYLFSRISYILFGYYRSVLQLHSVQKDYFGIIFYHYLIISILEPIILFKDTIKLIFRKKLFLTKMLQILFFFDLMYVKQLI